jgi:hypothetical protein
MKRYVLFVALLLSTLACQVLSGGGNDPQSQPPPPSGNTDELPEESSEGSDPALGVDTDFPLPDDATNVTEVSGTVNFQTGMSVEDAMKYYRDVFTAQGYTERELLTTLSDGVFSIVFDGHESGQSIVVQGVDLGNGATNVNIRLETLN